MHMLTISSHVAQGTWNSLVGSASMEVVINQNPVGGSCKTCSQIGCLITGKALVTTFVMSCSQWSDEDTP